VRARPAATAPGLPALLQFLRDPATHAGRAPGVPPLQVDTIETHMSWVFLVDAQVLKLKKPVRYPFLDFSTLAAREACCRDELRLNARLAPGVYRGLVAVCWQAGRYTLVPEPQLADRGAVVEWLVWMNRLPAARLLDRAIADDTVQVADVDALAEVLSTFYRQASRAAVAPATHWARVQHEQAITRSVLLQPAFDMPSAAQALDRLDRGWQRHPGLLQQRVMQGRLVDGHGDLRPEHVCLLQPPVVIDCLEFNAALRQVDPFDELALLALECDRAGAPWIGPRLVQRCAAALGDLPPPPLLPLYTASRALLRARLALAHLLEPQPRTPERWRPQAQRYVVHAQRALDLLDRLDGVKSGFSPATPRGCP
jgi:aminoglycoside phosphotransferase family enzyme